MKTLLFLALLMVCTIAFTQGTTQEEYNYVTKGYKIQQESGLDMKKGYSIKFYPETQSNGLVNWNEKAEVIGGAIFRDGQTNPCALILYYQNKNTGFKEYLCIPSNDADKSLWDAHISRFIDYAADARKILYLCSAKMASLFTTKK